MKIHLGDKYIEPQTESEYDRIIKALTDLKPRILRYDTGDDFGTRLYTDAEASAHIEQWEKDWNKL